ncbi:hypothetical protein [Devosia soli]|uniref:hypothetical protein n=1 Tax=Devosia soli TaxID=361041 RepID=UPI000B1FB29F|nr:hypothetical protein [Devosia soli]
MNFVVSPSSDGSTVTVRNPATGKSEVVQLKQRARRHTTVNVTPAAAPAACIFCSLVAA